MAEDHKAMKLRELIGKLEEHRLHLHESLGELLSSARSWAQSDEPELTRRIERLSELMQVVLTEVDKFEDEVDDILDKQLAEEFVKNYIQKPGSK